MDIQRLRNLTTGRLHTKIDCVYQDLEYITGEKGLMTHMLPRVMQAVEPWLKTKVKDARFWDGKYDKTHTGDFDLPQMSKEESDKALEIYLSLPNPLENKDVVYVAPQRQDNKANEQKESP